MNKQEAQERLFKARAEIEAVRRELQGDPERQEHLQVAHAACGDVISDLRDGRANLKGDPLTKEGD